MRKHEYTIAQGDDAPKPGSDRPFAYRQVISLGVPANESGFERAEREARILGDELQNLFEKFEDSLPSLNFRL